MRGLASAGRAAPRFRRTPPGSGTGRLDALVLKSVTRPALVCVRALGSTGKAVGLVDTVGQRPGPAAASRWTSALEHVPEHGQDGRAWADALVALAARYRPDVLVPVDDESVEALRRHRAEVSAAVPLALAPEPALAAAVDKGLTLAAAVRVGVPVPCSVLVRDPSEVSAALAAVGVPAVVKPTTSWTQGSWSAGRLTASAVRTSAEATAAVRHALAVGAETVVQPWLCGSREAVSVFVAHGRVWAAFAQVAHRTTPPLGGTSVVRESIPVDGEIREYAEALLLELGYEGYAEVEFRRDAHGRPLLMEINPRLSASVEIALAAGVDFPALLHAHAAGAALRPAGTPRAGVRMRWLGGDVRWLAGVVSDHGRPDVPSPSRALSTFVRDFARPYRYDYVDARDPLPAVAAVGGALRRAPSALAVLRGVGPARA